MTNCPICYIEITKAFFVTICGHSYHVKCIDEWLKTNKTCPYCRKKLYYRQKPDRKVSELQQGRFMTLEEAGYRWTCYS